MIRALLLDAHRYLADGGMVAIVVVLPLEQSVLDLLADPSIEVTLHQTTAAHAVFHYRFTSKPPNPGIGDGFEQGTYDRGEVLFPLEGPAVPLRTAYGLPEFDTLSFETELLLKAYQDSGSDPPARPSSSILVRVILRLRSGVGFDPQPSISWIATCWSLRYARENLVRGGCPAAAIGLHHQTNRSQKAPSPILLLDCCVKTRGPTRSRPPLPVPVVGLLGAGRSCSPEDPRRLPAS